MSQPLDELDLSQTCDLIVLTPKDRAVRCRRPGDSQVVTVRAGTTGLLVPGQIVTLQPTKAWRFNGHPYLSGEIQRTRIDPAALGMPRLSLNDYGWWDPLAELDVDEPESLEPWETEILALGPRRCFEMEQVLPGAGHPEDLSDPILDAVDLRHAGDGQGADELLFGALEADLRCLDAHAHLAGAAFEAAPSLAIDSAEVGVRIGQWSLGEAFNGILPWGLVDNRPYLRCLKVYGLALWALQRWAEAEAVFETMLRLNPIDNQGARFVLSEVRARMPWSDSAI